VRSLTIERVTPYLLEEGDFLAVLVGCGGTGSHLALVLAKLAAHCRAAGGPVVRLVMIDGDVVEDGNVGRQLFAASEVGRNKAQALAGRFNAVFGLTIEAIPRMADADLLRRLLVDSRERHILLLGAVDGAAGRWAIHEALESDRGWAAGRRRRVVWLDAGNTEHGGQVLVGAATTLAGLKEAIVLNGLCRALPAPSLVAPELLESGPARHRLACAAAVADNRQALLVNQMMATIAGQYAVQLVLQRRISSFVTEVDLTTLSMRSTPITAGALAEVIDRARRTRRRRQRQQRKEQPRHAEQHPATT
jgi:PRTRC genetic system ThiF family protein